MYGKSRCEGLVVFLIFPQSPWCHYFCVMMQPTKFYSSGGEKHYNEEKTLTRVSVGCFFQCNVVRWEIVVGWEPPSMTAWD